LSFNVKKEGEIFEEKSVSLKDFALDEIKDKVSFMQGDACNLKDIYKDYDLIFCSNLQTKLVDKLVLDLLLMLMIAL